MLAEATITRGTPDDTQPAATLDIATSEGDSRLVFGSSSAAGRASIRALGAGDPTSGITDDRLHAVFARTGLLPWRDDRAMPAVARDPTRLTITAPSPGSGSERARLELARAQGRWGLLNPIVERAESAAVQSSIDSLGRLTIVAFRDDSGPARIGLDVPRVTIQVQGGRGPDAYQWLIEIGAPASADGNQVFARLTGHRGEPDSGRTIGPVYAVLGLDALSGVFTNPEAYLSRTSLEVPAADIRRFTIKTPDGSRAWRYERTLDGWQVTGPSAAGPRPATSAEAAAIPAVLAVLTGPSASSALAEPTGVVALATLEVEGSSGLVAETITIARAPGVPAGPQNPTSAATTTLVVRAGDVWRRYPEMPEPFAVLLPVLP